MINFIDPIDPREEYSCRLWALFSLILTVLFISAIGCIQVSQLMTFVSIRKEYRRIQNVLSQNRSDEKSEDALICEQDSLQQKITLMTKMHEKFNKRIQQLEELNKACGQTVQLSSCVLSDEQLSIELLSSSIDAVNTVISALIQSKQFDDLLITSITPQKNGLQVVVKESVKNNLNSVK